VSRLPEPSAPTEAAPYGLRDLTALAPAGYRVGPRALDTVDVVVLHQTGFAWARANPMWARVRSHFTIHRDGLIDLNTPVSVRMRYGSGVVNRRCVTIEHEGNYPTSYGPRGPRYFKPEKFGRHVLADAPAQVEASRALLRHLRESLPALRYVAAHRQIESGKPGCPGPDLWLALGEWAARELGLEEFAPLDSGLPIDDRWRVPPPSPSPT
jgi:N-acetyl-anhydromuramyl-L-alanine amidase AmpD